tara:strand:- start:4895 stop:5350 length:456 start_codon:yes stop_codon:yes gene_type:complete
MKELFENFRRFVNEEQQLAEGLTLSPKEYARRAQALGQSGDLDEYGTLLGELFVMYNDLVKNTPGRREYGLPPLLPEELQDSISVEAVRAIATAVGMEEETADNLANAQKLQSAARIVPVGKDPLIQLFSSPLAKQKMQEHPVVPDDDDDL